MPKRGAVAEDDQAVEIAAPGKKQKTYSSTALLSKLLDVMQGVSSKLDKLDRLEKLDKLDTMEKSFEEVASSIEEAAASMKDTSARPDSAADDAPAPDTFETVSKTLKALAYGDLAAVLCDATSRWPACFDSWVPVAAYYKVILSAYMSCLRL